MKRTMIFVLIMTAFFLVDKAGAKEPNKVVQEFFTMIEENKISEDCNWSSFSYYNENAFVEGKLVKSEKLSKAIRNIHLRFFLRPRIIFGILSELKSFKQFKVGFRMLLYWLGINKIQSK